MPERVAAVAEAIKPRSANNDLAELDDIGRAALALCGNKTLGSLRDHRVTVTVKPDLDPNAPINHIVSAILPQPFS